MHYQQESQTKYINCYYNKTVALTKYFPVASSKPACYPQKDLFSWLFEARFQKLKCDLGLQNSQSLRAEYCILKLSVNTEGKTKCRQVILFILKGQTGWHMGSKYCSYSKPKAMNTYITLYMYAYIYILRMYVLCVNYVYGYTSIYG